MRHRRFKKSSTARSTSSFSPTCARRPKRSTKRNRNRPSRLAFRACRTPLPASSVSICVVPFPRVRLRCAQSHFSAEAGVRLALICTVLFWSLATLTLRAEPPAREQIARWIKELGDDDYASREHASKQLWQAGATAESAVFEAVQSADPEVARRARVLAQKFRWGIYPDTQPRIVERIERYRSADESGKQALIKELFEM